MSGISFAPIFVRLSEVGPAATAFYRLLFALPFFGLWLICRGKGYGVLSLRDLRKLCWSGLFFAADLAIWHWSIKLTSVANATLLANLAPVFLAVGAWLFLSEQVRARVVFGLLLTASGAVLVARSSFSRGLHHLWGDGLAVLAAVFYALYLLSVKRLRKNFSTPVIMTWTGLVSCPVLLLASLVSRESLAITTARGWEVLLGLAFAGQIAGQTLIAYAFAFLPASFSSLNLFLQPVLAALLASWLLGEDLTAMQGLGGCLVLSGIIMASWKGGSGGPRS